MRDKENCNAENRLGAMFESASGGGFIVGALSDVNLDLERQEEDGIYGVNVWKLK